MKKSNVSKNILLYLTIFQVFVIFFIGAFIVVDFPSMLKQFGVGFQEDMGILKIIMLYNAALSFCVCLWSVIWIRKNNVDGIKIGTTVGLLLFIVSMMVFIQFNRVDILLFDGVRGLFMVIFGGLAYKEHQKSKVSIA